MEKSSLFLAPVWEKELIFAADYEKHPTFIYSTHNEHEQENHMDGAFPAALHGIRHQLRRR